MNATSAKTAMIYRDRLAIWADKYLFILLFIAGSIAILAMKVVHVSQFVVTAVPVGTMLLYGTYVLFTPRYRIRSDRAGDSLYYLGFLYTMVSLAYSLYEFKKSESNTSDVVTNFGIALATTIVGLALRVVYHQMREDPFDTEQEARLELAEAAKRLHGVLLKTEADFDRLRLTVSQVVTEAANDTKSRLKAIAEEAESTTKIQTQFLSQFSEEAAKELRAHHSEMLSASRNMTNGVKRIAERIEGVEIPPDIIKSRLEMVAIPSEIIKDRLENVQIPSDLIKGRMEKIEIPEDLIKDRLQKVDIPGNLIRERLEAVEIPADIFTAKFNDLVRQLQEAVTAFSEGAARNASVMQVLEAQIKSAAELADKLKSEVAAAQTDDENRRTQLNASLAAFTNAVTSLEATTKALAVLSTAHVDEQKNLLDGLAASTALSLKTVEVHRQHLENDLNSSATAVQKVHGSLVSLTRTVVEKINGRA